MASEMQLGLVASLLRRGRSLDGLSSGLSLLALVIGLAPLLGAPSSPLAALLCVLLVVLGLVQKHWALRVAVDAELFTQMAACDQLEARTRQLDQSLVELGLQAANLPSRSWSERSRGALRLLRQQTIWLLAQLTVALASIAAMPWLFPAG